MIKPFRMADLGFFLPNEFSDPDKFLDQLLDPSFTVQSMWHEGWVVAILIFKNYWGRNWYGCFLIADDFPPRLIVALRKHVEQTMEEKDALRLQTHSVACEKLENWHKYLGFKCEGLHEKMLFDRDYKTWARMRGGN